MFLRWRKPLDALIAGRYMKLGTTKASPTTTVWRTVKSAGNRWTQGTAQAFVTTNSSRCQMARMCERDAGDISARPRKARDQPGAHGISRVRLALARAVTRRAAGNRSRMSWMHLPDSSAVTPSPNLSSNRSNLPAKPPELRSTASGSAADEGAFAAMEKERPDAVIVQPSLPSKRAAELALKHHVPAVSVPRWFAEEGGLMSYSARFADLYRKAAVYVDKILKGAQPADLPVEQPTIFEMVINLRTAKALGLTIPPAFIARADKVID